MVRILRIVVDYPLHMTRRGVRFMDIFHTDQDLDRYLQFVKEEIQKCQIDILAWCLMTNHVHFIAVPHDENSLARGFGGAHKRYTRMKNFSDDVRVYLFQGRFGSCVPDERHSLAAARYVESNPIAEGMAKHAWQYKWSSAAYHVGGLKKDVLVKSRNLYGLIRDWRKYLEERRVEDDDVLTVRKSTRTGRPAGDHDFERRIERLTGRVLQRRKPGPKKQKS